jgi:hypothetical protein
VTVQLDLVTLIFLLIVQLTVLLVLNLTVEETAGIGAGIIAAIVIGAVVFSVAVGIGGKKGYDLYKQSKFGSAAITDNPLYHGPDSTFDNPIWEADA